MTTFEVKDMTCGHCVSTITKAVKALDQGAKVQIDSRLDGHPYQVVVVSYHGAPIILQKEVWGTMCHFDLSDLPMPDDEFELLNAAAAAWPTATPAERTASKPLGDF